MSLTLLILAAGLVSVPQTGQQGRSAAEESRRVFVTDSDSWEISGGWSADTERAAGVTRGGARPQTAEIMKTFRERCPMLTVTIDRSRADYRRLARSRGWQGVAASG
jgi:hypothetical protein